MFWAPQEIWILKSVSLWEWGHWTCTSTSEGLLRNTTSPSWLDHKVIKHWFRSDFFPSHKNPPSQTHCASYWGAFVVCTRAWRWRVGRWAAGRFEHTTVTTEENLWNWGAVCEYGKDPARHFLAQPHTNTGINAGVTTTSSSSGDTETQITAPELHPSPTQTHAWGLCRAIESLGWITVKFLVPQLRFHPSVLPAAIINSHENWTVFK